MFAARVSDMHVCPLQTPPVPIPHVGGPIVSPIPGKPCLIGNLPAAGQNSTCICVGPPDMVIAVRNVLVNNIPLARMGDSTVHGGTIVMGCFNVLVGAGAMNPSAVAGMAADAQAAGASVVAEASAVMDEISEANDTINELLEQDNLTEAQQNQLNDLQGDFGDSINDMGMNDEGYTDWTE